MKRLIVRVSCLLMMLLSIQAFSQEPLKLVQTIPMPNVQGRIDHMGFDVKGHRLFVAALINNTLEVVDVSQGKKLESISGFSKPQGVYYVPRLKKVFVANGNDGTCKVLAGNPFGIVASVPLSLGADQMDFDRNASRLYVGHGGKDAGKDYGEIALIDPASDKQVGTIKTAVHPGGFAIENGRGRMFVTLPENNETIVIDRKTQQVTGSWPLPSDTQQPVALALDEANHRLLVGTRKPPRVVVYDTDNGKIVAEMETVGVLDGLYLNPKHKQIYASGGEGFLVVYQQKDPDHYEQTARIATSYLARTSLFVPELDRLYVALPKNDQSDAEIRVYQPQ
ncbi:MAG TPA: YncE family protein [Terriglobales bacterium]|jgi:DNA-binding beta-propeller fold protein YncE|nr:YncE family protein [Terriglobales bacterium]